MVIPNTENETKDEFVDVIISDLRKQLYDEPTSGYCEVESILGKGSIVSSLGYYLGSTSDKVEPILGKGSVSFIDADSELLRCKEFLTRTNPSIIEPQEWGEETGHGEYYNIKNVLSMLVRKGIRIPEPTIVIDYLSSYPEMLDLLPYICVKAKEEFNSDTQLSLEIYSDPEIDDTFLTLYIRKSNYDEHLLDKIDDFLSKYEDELSQKTRWFHITTDFRKPKIEYHGF